LEHANESCYPPAEELEKSLSAFNSKIATAKATKLKINFWACIIPQLRTPMNAIIGFSQCCCAGFKQLLTPANRHGGAHFK
jgi:signal transduction histidine kinase